MVFAAFVFARTGSGLWAATTRPSGGIGLPGGKVEPGETPAAAALREACEEGWRIDVSPRDLRLVHRAQVDGRLVVWFATDRPARRLSFYKELGRVVAMAADLPTIANSGHGNDDAVAELRRRGLA